VDSLGLFQNNSVDYSFYPPPLEIKIQLDYSVEWEMHFGWDYLREAAGSIHFLSSLSIIET
jgi:hypothetical protein